MNYDFWASRWTKNKTGWHLRRVHPKLIEYWPQLGLGENSTVLVPFCGKSLDLDWLAERHQRVIGIELVEQPVRELITERHPDYHHRKMEPFTIYETDRLEIWNGDFFQLNPALLQHVDGIYDRGSIVSLPSGDRRKYAEKCIQLAASNTRILLIVFAYNQEEMEGPPFSVPPEEVEELFGNHFKINHLLNQSIFDEVDNFRRKGLTSYMDLNVYHLYNNG